MWDSPFIQAILLVVLGILLVMVVQIFERRTGKSLTEMFFGIKRKSRKGQEKQAVKKEPHVSNGTKGELLSFLSNMIRLASKNGMQMVVPGAVAYQGEAARLSGLLVTPGGIIGLYCLGFGGMVTPIKSPAPWKQHINGEDRTFPNPKDVCKEQQKLVQAAMEEAGIPGHVDVVTIFTNPRVSLVSRPSGVYTEQSFIEHIQSTSSLKNGDLDVEKTAKALAKLAGIEDKKRHRG